MVVEKKSFWGKLLNAFFAMQLPAFQSIVNQLVRT
jgi:hypothetical protein